MSTTQVIDGKVVEMKFDNADFEKNVAQSMSTLEKLKQSLNFDSGKSLQDLGKAANGFNLNGVSTAVDAVQARFSALQVVGYTALSELTKAAMNFGAKVVSSVINPIRTGGMNRAMNIEQAKFQLEGLGVAWADIEEDINYGVKDTAYGLDAAAKAASQLTASGVKLGDEMKNALRGISGVAAMTNTSFEEISPIFTTVAGQGKLMTMQLRQLESRGLNAAATLGKYLGKTEAQVRDMVTKGQIDFNTFAAAMDDAFGAHAKDANKTFTGAMSNVKAAMSRIGANFATPYMENMRKIFVALIDVINGINKALDPVYKEATKIMDAIQTRITGFLSSTGLKNGYIALVNSLQYAFYALLLVVTPIKQAFKDIFPSKSFANTFQNLARGIEKFTSQMILSEENADKLRVTFRGLFAILDIIKEAFGGLFRAIKPYTGSFNDILSAVLDFTSGIAEYILNVRKSIKENNTFEKAFSKVAYVIANAAKIVSAAFTMIVDSIKSFKANHIDDKDFSGFTNFVDSVKNRLASFEDIGKVVSSVFEHFKESFEGFGSILGGVVKLITDSIGGLLRGFSGAFGGTGSSPFNDLLNLFSTIVGGNILLSVADGFARITREVKNAGGLKLIISDVRTELNKTFYELEANLRADTIMKIAKAIAVFAGSLLVLSLINPGRLLSSMVAVEVLINTLKDFAAFITTISKTTGMFQTAAIAGIASSLVTLGSAILVLSLAMKVMSSMNLVDLAKGLGSVILLIKVLSDVVVKQLSLVGNQIIKGSGMLIALAVAIRILASAVKAFGSLDLPTLAKGLSSVIVLIYSLAGAIKLMGNVKIRAGVAVSLLAMAASLLILSKAVEKLGALDLKTLGKGIYGVIAGVIAMAGALTVLGTVASGGKLLAASIALLSIAGALSIFASVVERLAALDLTRLIGGTLGAIAAITAMAGALAMLSVVSTGGTLLAAGAALVLMATSINILAGALEKLSKIPFLTLIGDILVMFATLAGFAVLTALVSPVIPLMAALAGVILLLGTGVLALGAGVATLSAGLATLATAATAVVANLGAILVTIVATITGVAVALANGIIAFAVTLAAGGKTLVSAVVALLKEILNGIITLMPDIMTTIVTFITELLEAIVALTPEFVSAALRLLAGFMEGLAEGMPQLVASANNLFISFLNSIAESIERDTPRIIEAMGRIGQACLDTIIKYAPGMVEVAKELIIKLGEGLIALKDHIKEKAKEIVDSIKEKIREKISDMVQLGKDFIAGFLKGLEDVPVLGGVVKAAEGIAEKAINAVKSAQKSNSPSKETQALGNDFGDGYALGIDESAPAVEEASEGMASKALKPLEAAANTAKGLWNTITAYNDRYGKTAKNTANATKNLDRWLDDSGKSAAEYKDEMEEATEQNEEFAESLDEVGSSAKGAAKEQKSFLDTIKDTVENQLDIFSKFDLKTGVTAEQMLENMRSNIDGFASWSHRLAVLAERGIDQALYKKLAEMGPNAYETVNAFVNMTDEQLQEANQLFATSMTLPQSQADIVQAGFTYAGEMATQGFSNALAQHDAAHAAAHGLGQSAIDGLNESLGIASPSKMTYQSGTYAVQGLTNAFINQKSLPALELYNLGVVTLNMLKAALSPLKTYLVGTNAITGLINGFNIKKEDVYNSMKDIGAYAMQGLQAGIDENSYLPLGSADGVATSIINTISSALRVASPSKVMKEIGKYVSLGLAIGITDGAKNVINACDKLATATDEEMNGAVLSLQDVLATELDFNPTITPIFDLSVLRSQMAEISSMMDAGQAGYGMTGTDGTGQIGTSQINFTQNNYSPKALSRYEIYRNTRNQIKQIKGVMSTNA